MKGDWVRARMLARFSLALLLVLSAACAALSRREKVALAEDRLSRARELDAAHVAAEPFARFEAALRAAEALAPEAAGREETVSEARLWLETAIAQAETATLARERLLLERETVRHDQTYLDAERARLALGDAREQELAAEIAREEAKRALARAALSPALRVKLSAEDTRRAALSLLTRAELIALAVDESFDQPRTALLLEIEKARALLATKPSDALLAADGALLAALGLVAKTRDANAAPSAEQKASLVEALALLGADVTRTERGLSAALPKQPSASSIARICELARGYPHGRVEVQLGALREPQGSAPAKHGCTGQRFVDLRARHTPGGAGKTSPGEALVSFTFLAY